MYDVSVLQEYMYSVLFLVKYIILVRWQGHTENFVHIAVLTNICKVCTLRTTGSCEGVNRPSYLRFHPKRYKKRNTFHRTWSLHHFSRNFITSFDFFKNRTLPFPSLAASRQDTLSSTRRLLLSFQWTACVCRCVKGFHRQTHGCAFLEYRETKLYGPVLPHKSYCQKINKWKTRERLIVADLFKVNKMVCMYSFP